MNERNKSFFKNQCMGCVRRCPESPVIRTADGAEYQGAERRKEVEVCRDWPMLSGKTWGPEYVICDCT